MTNPAERFHQRYCTALIADAAFRAGVPVTIGPAQLAPLDRTSKLAGPVQTVAANNDLVSILVAVHRAAPGDVVVVANRTQEVGLLGDIIATEARRKGLGGFVVDGLVRDVPVLFELGVPVFCRGSVPVGPLKLAPAMKGIGEPGAAVKVGGGTVRPGQWVFGDADGVVFLDAEHLDAVYEAAELSMKREQVLLDAMADGQALGDILEVEAFFAARERDGKNDFNAHLVRIGRAI
jgi:regulator of RNase E activity RraA